MRHDKIYGHFSVLCVCDFLFGDGLAMLVSAIAVSLSHDGYN